MLGEPMLTFVLVEERGLVDMNEEPRDFDQTIVEACEDASFVTSAEHNRVCRHCGQTFDTRVLSQVMHHDRPQHEPTRMNR
jgi:hypothetical protein